MEKLNSLIDSKWIEMAEKAGACDEALSWLEKERTWEELKEKFPHWYVWALLNISELPPDLSGLNSYYRREVLIGRPDCPINLDWLDPWDRMQVMISRPDCPINFTGLSQLLRVMVMAYRSDCPIDFTGIDLDLRAIVMANRPDCPINFEGLTPSDRAYIMLFRKDCPVIYDELSVFQIKDIYIQRTLKGWPCPEVPKRVKPLLSDWGF